MNMRTLLALSASLLLGAGHYAAEPGPKSEPEPLDRRLAELVLQLDHDKFDRRRQAAEELVRIGKPAAGTLQRLLAANPSLEVRSRAEAILKQIKPNNVQALRHWLNQPLVQLDEGIDPDTALRDALDYLADRYDLEMTIDRAAFAAIGLGDEKQIVQLPPTKDASMDRVLRQLLGQLQTERGQAAYSLTSKGILVTTSKRIHPAEWVDEDYRLAPRVSATFQNEELDGVLQDLAELSGVKVVVDQWVSARARGRITKTFTDVTVYSAVHVLAKIAGLSVAVLEDTLYVTDKENARALQAQEEQRRSAAGRPTDKPAAVRGMGYPTETPGEVRLRPFPSCADSHCPWPALQMPLGFPR